MRKNRARVIPAILILLVLLFTSACGGSNTPAAQSTQSTSAATAAVTSESTAQTIDPLGKYDPAIDMTTVNVRLNPNDTLPEGQSAEKNVLDGCISGKTGHQC